VNFFISYFDRQTDNTMASSDISEIGDVSVDSSHMDGDSNSSSDGSDTSDDVEFPANVADNILEKYKDEISKGDSWLTAYRDLVPMMREELAARIVEAIINIQAIKGTTLFKDLIERQKFHKENEDVSDQEALERAVYDNAYTVAKLIPFHPDKLIARLLEQHDGDEHEEEEEEEA
jgi:hypothetical protein